MMLDDKEGWEEFLDNSTVGIHLVDAKGIIIWANRTELAFLGYSADEYVGRPISEFHIDQDVITTILNLLTSGESLSTYPARLRANDGTSKFVLINSNVYQRDDQFVHTRCFTTGISEAIYLQLRAELNDQG